MLSLQLFKAPVLGSFIPNIRSVLSIPLYIIIESPHEKTNVYKEMVSGILGIMSRTWQMEKALREIPERSLILLIKTVHFQYA